MFLTGVFKTRNDELALLVTARYGYLLYGLTLTIFES